MGHHLKRLAALLLFLCAAIASGQNYILTQTLGTPRNDADGWFGLNFATAGNTPQVMSLCRWKISGNSQVHNLYLYRYVDGSSDVQIAAATVDLSAGSVGTYICSAGGSGLPATLLVSTTYYVISQEANAGDQFYNWVDSTADSFTSGVGTFGGAMESSMLGTSTLDAPGPAVYGIVNFTVSPPPTPTVTPTATPTGPTPTPTNTPTATPSATVTPTSPPCSAGVPKQTIRHVGSGTYQVTQDDGIIFAEPSLGAVTLLLPANPAMCTRYIIKRLPGIYNVVVDGNGKKIDGFSSRTMNTVNAAIKIVFQPQFNWGIF